MSKKSKKYKNQAKNEVAQSERDFQGDSRLQSEQVVQSNSRPQSKNEFQSGYNPQSMKTDAWEKDFIKEVEQAEHDAEKDEFDEAELLAAEEEQQRIQAEHAEQVIPGVVEVSSEVASIDEASDLGDDAGGENVETPNATEEVTGGNEEYDPAADLASDDDLKLLGDDGAKPRKSILHKINVRMPWLKIIFLIILIVLMAFAVGKFVQDQIAGPGASGGDTTAAVLNGGGIEVDDIIEVVEEVKKTVETEPATSAIPETVIPSGDGGGAKLVALTFDDGPSAATTWRLLDILAEKQVRATFFVLGNMVLRNPDLLRAELAAGHEVGSHTVDHANLPKTSVDGIRWEVQRMNEIFAEVTGGTTAPVIMRPPYGAVNDTVRAQTNQPLILWTVDTEDWRYRDAAEVRRRALAGVFDGAIILLHDIHPTTIDAVAGIIDDLRASGYTIVTVSQMAAARGVSMQNGWTYGSFRP